MATAQATSTSPPAFPAKGSFKRMPFPRLLREIARRKLTGSLYLLSDQTKKVVFFEDGLPTFVRSNVLAECLGQVLSQEGLITHEQCEQTLEAIRRTGKKQGELLVEMGILSEGNLRYGLEAQLRTKLYEIFGWEEGRYQFKSDSPQTTIGVRLELSPQGIIVDAIQERYSEERARRALEPMMGLYPSIVDPDRLAACTALLPEERHFAQCLDGSRKVTEVLEDPSTDDVPTPGCLLLGLIYGDFCELPQQQRPRRPRPPAPRSSAHALSDDELRPSFEARNDVTEYEDTPAPGALPRDRGVIGHVDESFDDVGDFAAAKGESERLSELVAAEPDEVEETFDDADLLDDDVELVEEPTSGAQPPPPPPTNPTLSNLTTGVHTDVPGAELDVLVQTLHGPLLLLDPSELDDIDLEIDLDDDRSTTPGELLDVDEVDAVELSEDDVAADDENPEILGAIRFNEAESAMAAEDYPRAVELLQAAYEHGFDVAELHAMLAFARFRSAGGTAGPAANHALELLDYAGNMDPSLDLVHAYRGAILLATRQVAPARQALQRALELNPYCELATHLMDQL